MPSLQSFLFRIYLNYLKATIDWNDPVEKLRLDIEKGARLIKPHPKVSVKPVVAYDLRAEWLCPPQANKGQVMLYLHGGGYASGSCASHRALVSRLAYASKICGLVLEYRLAPEHPFPAAIEDAQSAYAWLLQEGFKPHNVVFAGDSAGGGLALATLLALRDKSNPLPAAAVCLSPLTDVAATGESMITNAKRDPWLKPEAQTFFRHYVGRNDPRLPLISPLYGDLHGLPPLLIHVGQDEILLSDSTRLAEKARVAGVDTTLEVWARMWHVFHIFAPLLPEAQRAIAAIGLFIQQRLEQKAAAP